MSAKIQAQAYPAIILAGGKSRRMGTDKAEIRIGNDRLIDRVFARIAPQACFVMISGPNSYGLNVEIIPDDKDGPAGPVAGIYAAYKYFSAQDNTFGFYVVPVDTPDIPEDLAARLYGSDHSSIAEDPIRTHPSIAWWRTTDLKTVFASLDFSENISLHRLAELAAVKTVNWSEASLFRNINTPNDVTEYLTVK